MKIGKLMRARAGHKGRGGWVLVFAVFTAFVALGIATARSPLWLVKRYRPLSSIVPSYAMSPFTVDTSTLSDRAR